MKPLENNSLIPRQPFPPEAKSGHPFLGGETKAHDRVNHLITTGAMSKYHETRNGLLGEDFSTKLSGYLALGAITARQIHSALMAFEDGTNQAYAAGEGYAEGENAGTKAIRFELLWRDYMRLCTRKFSARLFALSGFTNNTELVWEANPDIIRRFTTGTTGTGLIDASLRELLHTGYTSNRARQNVASYLAKHLRIDWRIGAEWYECMLVDYDLSSNWGNWQYVAGVGNDPRVERKFNPVKQAFDYDPSGEYVKAWVPELRPVERLSEVFQAWTIGGEERGELELDEVEWVENPLLKIDFTVGKTNNRPYRRGRGAGSSRGGIANPGQGAPRGNGGNGNGGGHAGGNGNGGGRGGFLPPRGPRAQFRGMPRGGYGRGGMDYGHGQGL